MFLFFKGMDVSIVISEPSTRNDTSRSRRSHKQGHSRRSHTSHEHNKSMNTSNLHLHLCNLRYMYRLLRELFKQFLNFRQ
jgi:hypothetical protein